MPLGPPAASVNAVDYPTIGAALAVAPPGSAVTIRPGVHGPAEDFPLTVPKGVRLLGEPGAVVDASAGPPRVAAILLAGNGAALHHVTVIAPSPTAPSRAPVAVGAMTAVKVAVRACTLQRGGILVTGGSGVSLTGNTVDGGRIVVRRSTGTQIIRNQQSGEFADAGIAVDGGAQHTILGNLASGSRVGVALTGATACEVSGNGASHHDTGVEIVDCHDTVVGHSAIDSCVTGIRVIGGDALRVIENDVADCDTAIDLGAGAQAIVEANRVRRARVGVAVHPSAQATIVDNELTDCSERGIARDPGDMG